MSQTKTVHGRGNVLFALRSVTFTDCFPPSLTLSRKVSQQATNICDNVQNSTKRRSSQSISVSYLLKVAKNKQFFISESIHFQFPAHASTPQCRKHQRFHSETMTTASTSQREKVELLTKKVSQLFIQTANNFFLQLKQMTPFSRCLFISLADHMALPSITLSISHTNNDNNNRTSDLDFPSGI